MVSQTEMLERSFKTAGFEESPHAHDSPDGATGMHPPFHRRRRSVRLRPCSRAGSAPAGCFANARASDRVGDPHAARVL